MASPHANLLERFPPGEPLDRAAQFVDLERGPIDRSFLATTGIDSRSLPNCLTDAADRDARVLEGGRELLGSIGSISLGATGFTAFAGTLEFFHTMNAVGLTAGYAGVAAFAGGYAIGSGINYLVPPLREGRLGEAIYDKLHPEMNQIVVPVRRELTSLDFCPIR